MERHEGQREGENVIKLKYQRSNKITKQKGEKYIN